MVRTNTGKIFEHYDMNGPALGEGGFSSVRMGKAKGGSGAHRAIKSMPKKETNPQEFKIETEIMRTLDHPNIVRLYETYEDAKVYYLVLELCSGGELCDAIVASRTGFTEKVVATLVKQMVGAVAYMHSVCIVHRDLKPQNFLLADKTGIETSLLKMADFGLSQQFTPGTLLKSRTGTLSYAAPEVLSGSYNERCDVWSLGVILFFILSGQAPFYADDDQSLMIRIQKGHYSLKGKRWSVVSDDAKDLITKMFTLNPSKRPSASEVYHHHWVAKLAPNADNADLPKDIIDNLKRFQTANKLEKAALTVMAVQLSGDAVKELRDMFSALDKDGSGTITVEELKACISSQLSGEKVDAEGSAALNSLINEMNGLGSLVDDIDTNGNKVIDYSEFIVRMMDKKRFVQEDVCWDAFRQFDLDGSGAISYDELALVISGGQRKDMAHVLGIEKEEIERIIKETDQDGNGKIEFDEFMKMMQKGSASKVDANLSAESDPSPAA
jgi:calcium-dependent protein kinase